MSIEVTGVNKAFGAFRALTDIALTVQTGELVGLLQLVSGGDIG